MSTFKIRLVKSRTGQRQLFKERGAEPVPTLNHPPHRLGDLPELLTVEEAARYLRIGRGSAYELARRFRLTDGREGLPVLTLGRTLRVPRRALERLLTEVKAKEAHPQPAVPRVRPHSSGT